MVAAGTVAGAATAVEAGAGLAGASRLVSRSASVPPNYGGPYSAYGGDCVMRRRWVINRWGHRVLRWTRVCY